MLVTNLRFNRKSRQDLARKIAKNRISERQKALEDAEEKLALDYLDELWDTTCRNTVYREEAPTGLFPQVHQLSIIVNDEVYLINLNQSYDIPFEHYEEISQVIDENPTDIQVRLSDHIEAKIALTKEYNLTAATLNTYFRKFSAPKHLLENSPEFAEHFPKEWLEKDPFNALSIDSILSKAA